MELGIETTDLAIIGDTLHLSVTYALWEGDVKATEFALARVVNNLDSLEDSRHKLDSQALSYKATYEGYRQGRPSLQDLSVREVGRATADWSVTLEGEQLWRLEHPVSGTFTADLPLDERGLPELVGRARAVLAIRLPPPDWVEFTAPSVGQLRFRCAPVSDASKYAIYAYLGNKGYEKIGEAVTADEVLSVEAGAYNACVAAVDDKDVVGVPSDTSTIVVPAIAVAALPGEAAAKPKPKLPPVEHVTKEMVVERPASKSFLERLLRRK